MKEDPRPGVTAFAGIVERAVGLSGKVDAVADEFIDDPARRANHDIHRFAAVFVMAGFQRIFHEAVVISFIVKDADSPLSQERIAVFHVIFGNHEDLFIARHVEGGKEAAGTGTDDDNICFFCFHDIYLLLFG